MHPTDIHEVKLVTHKLKNKKTTSCDDLSTYIIQKTIDGISIPITHIINQSLYSGLVPDKLKISKITPIFKSGNNKHFNNYRPISILPPISKILDKIVCNRLIHFFRQIRCIVQTSIWFSTETLDYPPNTPTFDRYC